jgi:hypothetical protein
MSEHEKIISYHNTNHKHQPYSPVSLCASSTGFDCGDPFCLRKMDNITMANTDKFTLPVLERFEPETAVA